VFAVLRLTAFYKMTEVSVKWLSFSGRLQYGNQ